MFRLKRGSPRLRHEKLVASTDLAVCSLMREAAKARPSDYEIEAFGAIIADQWCLDVGGEHQSPPTSLFLYEAP
jgi:hypothetical protein